MGTWVHEVVAEFWDGGKKQMSGLCVQNENSRLEELPFLLPWLCCPLLMAWWILW